MTRDEAIEKVCAEIREELKKNICLSFRLHMNSHGITVGGYDFPFDPPRRIPPIGTPVSWVDSNGEKWSGISDGMSKFGDLVVKCPSFSTVVTNWIELAEVEE